MIKSGHYQILNNMTKHDILRMGHPQQPQYRDEGRYSEKTRATEKVGTSGKI